MPQARPTSYCWQSLKYLDRVKRALAKCLKHGPLRTAGKPIILAKCLKYLDRVKRALAKCLKHGPLRTAGKPIIRVHRGRGRRRRRQCAVDAMIEYADAKMMQAQAY
jgi:hypothetical protein